jgi:hypothetical protein
MKQKVVFSKEDGQRIETELGKINWTRLKKNKIVLSELIEKRTGIPKPSVMGYLSNRTKRITAELRKLDPAKRSQIERLLLKGRPKKIRDAKISTSEWIHRETLIPERTIAGVIANLSKTKNKITIIESTFDSVEEKSESKYLAELLRIYNLTGAVKPNPLKVSSKQKFLDAINCSKAWYLHISAHGFHVRKQGVTGIISGANEGSWLSPEDIKLKCLPKPQDEERIVVASACEVGQENMASAFKDIGYKYYIAPQEKVPWDDAALFHTLFYRFLLIEDEREQIEDAFNDTIARYPELKLPEYGCWRLFKDGIPIM